MPIHLSEPRRVQVENATLDTLGRIAKALGVNPRDLLKR